MSFILENRKNDVHFATEKKYFRKPLIMTIVFHKNYTISSVTSIALVVSVDVDSLDLFLVCCLELEDLDVLTLSIAEPSTSEN